jgi:hypothetical protein
MQVGRIINRSKMACEELMSASCTFVRENTKNLSGMDSDQDLISGNSLKT